MTLFQRMLQMCGLTTGQAADFFDESTMQVRAWSLNQDDVPAEVWHMLGDLHKQIEECADQAFALMIEEDVEPTRQVLGISMNRECDPMPKGAADMAGTIAAARMIATRPRSTSMLDSLLTAEVGSASGR